jgi:AcrR family transcriptional regulator
VPSAKPEKLSRAVVVARALALADTEGLASVTIRRLAQQLDVTPMALYWHFRNKDELLVGMLDEIFAEVTVRVDPALPWDARLRVLIEAVATVLRRHTWVAELFGAAEKLHSTGFARATDAALGVLREAGYDPVHSWRIATFLLHGLLGLVTADPSAPGGLTPQEAARWRRQQRLAMESGPAAGCLFLGAAFEDLEAEQDIEEYYRFGIDLLMAAITSLAPGGKG